MVWEERFNLSLSEQIAAPCTHYYLSVHYKLISGSIEYCLGYIAMDQYDINQLLGRGGFAEVYSARCRVTGQQVAIKLVDKDKMREAGIIDRVGNEVKIHSTLEHVNIVRHMHSFEDEHYFYIVMEQCESGNLYKYLKRNGALPERVAAGIIRQVLEAVVYMHLKGVVHRDLKLSNILLSMGGGREEIPHVSLCDFGLAVRLEHPDEEHFTLCGTPNYIAPEVVSKRAHGFPADLWSVGCLFYFLVSGAPPAEQVDVKDILARFLAMNEQNERTSELSHGALDFMQCLLKSNPLQRASAPEILEHPFLQVMEAVEAHHNKAQNRDEKRGEVLHDMSVGAESSRLRYYHQEQKRLQKTQKTPPRAEAEAHVSLHPPQELPRSDAEMSTMANTDSVLQLASYHDPYSSPSRTEQRREGAVSSSASTCSTAVTAFSQINLSRQEEASTQLRAPLASPEPQYTLQAQTPRHHDRLHSETRSPKERKNNSFAKARQGYFSPEADVRRSGDSTVSGVSRKAKNSRATHVPVVGPVPGPMPEPNAMTLGSSQGHGHGYEDGDAADDSVGNSWLGRVRDLRQSLQGQSSVANRGLGSGSGSGQSRGHTLRGGHRVATVPLIDSQASVAIAAAALDPEHVDATGTWVDACLQPFVYCKHNGELLVVSGPGDVLLCSFAKDRQGRPRRYRVCIRARCPLHLCVGNVTEAMEEECQRLCARRFGRERPWSEEEGHSGLTTTQSSVEAGAEDDGDYSRLLLLGKDGWADEPHDLRNLPPLLRRILYRVNAMLEIVKRRQPRLVVYMKPAVVPKRHLSRAQSTSHDGAQAQTHAQTRAPAQTQAQALGQVDNNSSKAPVMDMNGSKTNVRCKCMLMSNRPLPDFCVQWADGMRLRYALDSGQLQISGPAGQFLWDSSVKGGGPTQWASMAPKALRPYLLEAQKCMERCLMEQVRLDNDGGGISGSSSGGLSTKAKAKPIGGPYVCFVEGL